METIADKQVKFWQELISEWVEIQEVYFKSGNDEKADMCQSHINRLSHEIAELRRKEDRRKHT